MAQLFTLQQVEQHNAKTIFDKYAVVNGGVYRLSNIPWGQCKTKPPFRTHVVGSIGVNFEHLRESDTQSTCTNF